MSGRGEPLNHKRRKGGDPGLVAHLTERDNAGGHGGCGALPRLQWHPYDPHLVGRCVGYIQPYALARRRAKLRRHEPGGPRVRTDLPPLRPCLATDHADARVPILRAMPVVPGDSPPQAGRLLRVLLLRLGALPAGAAGTRVLRLAKELGLPGQFPDRNLGVRVTMR